ncbi:MAG: glycosyltransferase family 4 protein [Pirellulaceae bacterium]|nr:glycosyltransferase family 4 protein [Pirellulaceae bacterium]
MHILVLSDRFHPEISAPSFRVMDHAQEWLAEGHEVTIVTCAPNAPKGKVFPGYKNKLYQEEMMNGVRVIRVWSYMVPNTGTFKRTLDYISFAFSLTFFFWRYPRFDVVVATSPPLFVAFGGYLLSWLRWRPWVFEVRDLWPESIKATGASKSLLLKFFYWLEIFLYKKSSRVVVVTQAFQENLIARKISAEKIEVVTNGVDTKLFSRANITHNRQQTFGISPDKFLVGYFGTVGMAHGLETLVLAAEKCQHEKRIQFLIMGEGAKRAELEELAKQRKLTNIIFQDFVPHEKMINCWGSLDLSLVHLRPDPAFEKVIPSKIFEAMAMEVPMVYAVKGESAEIVQKANAGLCINPGDENVMARTILELASSQDKLSKLANSGRTFVKTHYSRTTKAKEMIDVLETVVKK